MKLPALSVYTKYHLLYGRFGAYISVFQRDLLLWREVEHARWALNLACTL